MISSRTAVLCGCCLLVGLAGGCGATWALMHRSTEQATAYAAAAGAGGKIRVLDTLREGNASKAIEMLEDSLDTDLIVLGLVSEHTIDGSMKRVIDRAGKYRKRHGYESRDPDTANSVSRVLATRAKEERDAR